MESVIGGFIWRFCGAILLGGLAIFSFLAIYHIVVSWYKRKKGEVSKK